MVLIPIDSPQAFSEGCDVSARKTRQKQNVKNVNFLRITILLNCYSYLFTLYFAALNLGKGTKMPRHYVPTAVSSPRLLASAIGVAITATSAGHMAFAADAEPAKNSAIALDATSVTGQAEAASTDAVALDHSDRLRLQNPALLDAEINHLLEVLANPIEDAATRGDGD